MPAAHLSLASLSLVSHYLSLSHRQVDGAVVSSIGRGIFVLVGVAHGDGPADVDWVARKLLSARLFPSSSAPASSSSEGGGEEGAPSSRWGSSVSDLPDGEILCVSQFTLLGSLKKGTRPDFKAAAAPAEAAETYGALLDRVREGFREPGSVKDGVFGAMMKVRSDRKERERETEGTETRSSQRSLELSKKEKTTKAQKFETFENRSRSSTTGP